MEIYEIKFKCYLLKDIYQEDSLEAISDIIDKTFLKTADMSKYHESNGFKEYCHDGFYPIEENKIYRSDNIYSFRIRTSSDKLMNHFTKFLTDEFSEKIKVLTYQKRSINTRLIEKIYSITPIVIKYEEGYWKNAGMTISDFEKRIKVNLIKKYNSFNDEKMSEDFDLFTNVRFDNRLPIGNKYKRITLLGDKVTLTVSENEEAQKLAYIALATGLGEMGSRGLGYVGYKFI